MRYLTFSFFFLFLFTNSANAACQWEYINELNKDIKHASGLLSDYSTCRQGCKGLESNLNSSVAKMRKSSGCESHILTAGNSNMINFIASRFRLIQKQKLGRTWTEGATGTGETAVVSVYTEDGPSIVLDKPAFIKPKKVVINRVPQQKPLNARVPVARRAPTPQIVKPRVVVRQTRMAVTQAAYEALWPENVVRKPQRNFQRAVIRKPPPNNIARQKLLAQQRLIKHRKQAQIQQNKMRLVKAKRLAMHNHHTQQRLSRQRLLKRRELMRHANRLRTRQIRLDRAQRLRSR